MTGSESDHRSQVVTTLSIPWSGVKSILARLLPFAAEGSDVGPVQRSAL